MSTFDRLPLIIQSISQEKLFTSVVLDNSPNPLDLKSALIALENSLTPFLLDLEDPSKFFKSKMLTQSLVNLSNFQYVYIDFFISFIKSFKRIPTPRPSQENVIFNLIGTDDFTLGALCSYYSSYLIKELERDSQSSTNSACAPELISMYKPQSLSLLSSLIESQFCDSSDINKLSLQLLSSPQYLEFYNKVAPQELINLITRQYFYNIEPLKQIKPLDINVSPSLDHPIEVKRRLAKALQIIYKLNKSKNIAPHVIEPSTSDSVMTPYFESVINNCIVNFASYFSPSKERLPYFHLSVEANFAVQLEDSILDSFILYVSQLGFTQSSSLSGDLILSQEFNLFVEKFMLYASLNLKPQSLSPLEASFVQAKMTIVKDAWCTLPEISPTLTKHHAQEVNNIKSYFSNIDLNNIHLISPININNNIDSNNNLSSLPAHNIINNLLISSCLWGSINNLDIKSLALIYDTFNNSTDFLSLPIGHLSSCMLRANISQEFLDKLPAILDVFMKNIENNQANSFTDFFRYLSRDSDFGELYETFERKYRAYFLAEKLTHQAHQDESIMNIYKRKHIHRSALNSFSANFLESSQTPEQIENAFLDSLLIGYNKKQESRQYALNVLMAYPEIKNLIKNRATDLSQRLDSFNSSLDEKAELPLLQKALLDSSLPEVKTKLALSASKI